MKRTFILTFFCVLTVFSTLAQITATPKMITIIDGKFFLIFRKE